MEVDDIQILPKDLEKALQELFRIGFRRMAIQQNANYNGRELTEEEIIQIQKLNLEEQEKSLIVFQKFEDLFP